MEFIVDNLVWFIVGGVIVLMTIIGYFAEKTNFGNKKNKEFILMWHNTIKAMNFRMKFVYDEDAKKSLNDILLNSFYRLEVEVGEDFYSAFYRVLSEVKQELGII